MRVTKVIIPAAGRGTRFLPATRAIPKEMIPLIDKPSIQYVVEEAIRSDLHKFILVTGPGKDSIMDHFSLTEQVNAKGRFASVRQDEPLGLGHAVLSARHLIEKEYVAVMLPDEIITGSDPAIGQLIKVATQEKCSVIAVKEVDRSEASSYGIIDVKKQFSPNLFQVGDLIEKPSPEKAPSSLAIVGRYVLSPGIFDVLSDLGFGAHGEIQLTDAIQKLLFSGEKIFAYKVKGERYDVGNPLGLLKASIMLSLKHQKYSKAMLDFLDSLDRDMVALKGKSEAIARLS